MTAAPVTRLGRPQRDHLRSMRTRAGSWQTVAAIVGKVLSEDVAAGRVLPADSTHRHAVVVRLAAVERAA